VLGKPYIDEVAPAEHLFLQLPLADGVGFTVGEHEEQDRGHKSWISFPLAARPTKANASAF